MKTRTSERAHHSGTWYGLCRPICSCSYLPSLGGPSTPALGTTPLELSIAASGNSADFLRSRLDSRMVVARLREICESRMKTYLFPNTVQSRQQRRGPPTLPRLLPRPDGLLEVAARQGDKQLEQPLCDANAHGYRMPHVRIIPNSCNQDKPKCLANASSLPTNLYVECSPFLWICDTAELINNVV